MSPPSTRAGLAAAVRATGAACAALLILAPQAWGQGLTARVAPELSGIRWSDETGLGDATFLGGGLSLGFGRYVTLRGSYRTAGTLDTDFFSAGYRPSGDAVPENRVGAALFAGGIQFRLGDGALAPLLTASGGLLELEPEGRERTRRILVGYGAGVDVRLATWLEGQIVMEDLRLRLDRSLLADPGTPLPPDPERGETRRGWGVTAAFGVRAGAGRGSASADVVDAGFGRLLAGDTEGLLVPVEAHLGAVRFDDALGLPDQSVLGVRTGLDFGPYFGVRGQYWKGVTDAFDAWQGVSGWTAEAQFNLGRVTGPAPFLLLGYGQTRFTDEFRQESGVAAEDQNALVVGVGAGIPLGDRARLTVTLRDYVTTAGDLNEAASPGDLRHSFGLSGGISVLVVGRNTRAAAAGGSRPPGTPGDSADYRSGQVIAVPVPREGEIYLRYGPSRTLPDSTATPPPGADSAAAAVPAALRPGAAEDASLEELRRQVDELARLVRESMGLQAAGLVLRPGGTTVNVGMDAGAAGALASAREPLVPALEARLGRTSVDGNGGLGLGVEAYFRSLGGEGNLFPFVGLEWARSGVDRRIRDLPTEGTLRSLVTDVGVTAVLPGLGPLWPTVGGFFTGVSGSPSASRPNDEATLERRYGGLSLGVGLSLGAAYRPDPEGRFLVTTSLRRAWAGGKSRWNLQAGARLVFAPAPRGPGPFSMRPPDAAPAAATLPAGTEHAADTLRDTPAPDSAAAALLARLDSLEAQVRRATEEREAALAQARDQRARADSLAAAAAAVPHAEARRDSLLAELRELAAASDHLRSVAGADGVVRLVLGGDAFPVGATEPGPAARSEIGAVAAILARRAGVSVVAEGHTDSTGSAEANLVISRLRAEAVAEALRAGGLSPTAVVAVGRGQDEPIGDNATREGRARNRRVELVVRLGLSGG